MKRKATPKRPSETRTARKKQQENQNTKEQHARTNRRNRTQKTTYTRSNRRGRMAPEGTTLENGIIARLKSQGGSGEDTGGGETETKRQDTRKPGENTIDREKSPTRNACHTPRKPSREGKKRPPDASI